MMIFLDGTCLAFGGEVEVKLAFRSNSFLKQPTLTPGIMIFLSPTADLLLLDIRFWNFSAVSKILLLRLSTGLVGTSSAFASLN